MLRRASIRVSSTERQVSESQAIKGTTSRPSQHEFEERIWKIIKDLHFLAMQRMRGVAVDFLDEGSGPFQKPGVRWKWLYKRWYGFNANSWKNFPSDLGNGRHKTLESGCWTVSPTSTLKYDHSPAEHWAPLVIRKLLLRVRIGAKSWSRTSVPKNLSPEDKGWGGAVPKDQHQELF